MNLIEIKDVCKIYNEGEENEVWALDHVNLSIEEGEYVAIVGTSGCGKSTLMNILGCLDTPSRGEYFLKGVRVRDMNDNELSRFRNYEVGFIFQNFHLISKMNALENVELPLSYQGLYSRQEMREIAKAALEKVGMENRFKHFPAQMSGGQQQRTAIARAIAIKPSIILADEPTGNLDSKKGQQVVGILRDLNKEGKTIVLITHDNGIAAAADRIVRIKDGKIIEDTGKKK